METVLKVLITSQFVYYCNGVNLKKQLEYLARRSYVDPSYSSVILGAPSMPSHLPEAEPILPGHTLLRPARGMLKSSIKFPHRDLEDGAGVYGNVNNLGISYDGKQDRVMYTGFRRMPLHKYFMNLDTMDSEYKKTPRRREPNKEHGTVTVLKTSDLTHVLIQLNKILKQYKDYNESVIARQKILRRELTPIGYILMDTPNAELEVASETSFESEELDTVEGRAREETHGEMEKKKWFWNTKDAYNHIIISPNAPEQLGLMPKKIDDEAKDYNKE